MSKAILSQLTADQKRAVTYGIKAGSHKLPGPLLILAGAGTGKTTTLARRVCYCVVSGADLNRMMVLAFGNRASQEMSQRTTTALGDVGYHCVEFKWTGTFHSVAVRFVRQYAHHVGLRSDFTVLDPSDAATLMASVRRSTKSSLPKTKLCLKIYTRMNDTGDSLNHVLADHKKLAKYRQAFSGLFRRYEKAKLAANVVDFGDLLKFWLILVRDSRIGDKIRRQIDYVFVDEYQDTNRLQADILLALKPDGRGLTVVGDDAQAIYSFRGALVANIREFPDLFTSAAKVIKLEQNFRSTQAILNVCNDVLQGAALQKNLWSDRGPGTQPTWIEVPDDMAQARYVAGSILRARQRGGRFSNIAVLVREAAHSAELEAEFARVGIPFQKFGGKKLVDSAVVRDALAILRWCENPKDRLAGARTLRILPGIGPVAAGRILNKLGGRISSRILRRTTKPKANDSQWRSFDSLLKSLCRAKTSWKLQLRLVNVWVAASRPKSDSRSARLEELSQIAARYSSRAEFLTEFVLDPPELSVKSENCVAISTIHSAKGREWKHVIVLNAVDGFIPSARANTADAREEERRLLHVAMSRAKNTLEIVEPRQLASSSAGGSVRKVQRLLSTTPFIDKCDPVRFRRRWFPRQFRRTATTWS